MNLHQFLAINICVVCMLAPTQATSAQRNPAAQQQTNDYPAICPKLALDAKEYIASYLMLLDRKDFVSIQQDLPQLARQRDALGQCASMQYYTEQTKHLSEFYGNFSSSVALLFITSEIATTSNNTFALTDARKQASELLTHLNCFGDLRRYLTIGSERQSVSRCVPEPAR